MANTNTKEASKKIQEHILNRFESYEDMMSELKSYQKNYGGSFGKTFAQEGNLLVYESEVDKFFQDALKQTPEEQGKYSPKETWELYTSLVQREAAHIVSEDSRSYIKPGYIKQEKPMASNAKESGWVVDEKDNEGRSMSEFLPYTSANGEKAFFLVEFGIPFVKLHCLRSDPSKLTEHEKCDLEPERGHSFGDNEDPRSIGTNKDSRLGAFKEVKELVENTVAILDGQKNGGKNHSFDDIKKCLGEIVRSYHAHQQNAKNFELAKKAGYVQGVCECVAAVGKDHALGGKLLKEMGVTKEMAKEYATPETLKALESGVFAQEQEQKIEHHQIRGRKR